MANVNVIISLRIRGKSNSLGITVYGSSCKTLLFGLILAHLLSLYTVLIDIPKVGWQAKK